MLHRTLLSIAYACSLSALRSVLRTWVWSPIVGTARVYIGAQHGVLPALYGRSHIATLVWSHVLQAVITWLFAPTWMAYVKLLPLPTLCASLYITMCMHLSRWKRVLCAALFALAGVTCFSIHPTGYAALWYTTYWCLPIIGAALSHTNTYAMMLGATFTAHIVGSCIWLYTTHMSAATWLALIPIVAIERLTCAAGLTLTYMLCTYAPFVHERVARIWQGARKQIHART